MLSRLESQVRTNGRYGRLITVRILQALTEAALNIHDSARHRLAQAIQLAAPEGHVRRFLDEGPQVAQLLPYVRSEALVFVDELLQAFSNFGNYNAGVNQLAVIPSNRLIYEPLTEQELKVLHLLAEGLSNESVAQRLVITRGTVKWHIHNIYIKLGVSNRLQGIVKGRELGLL